MPRGIRRGFARDITHTIAVDAAVNGPLVLLWQSSNASDAAGSATTAEARVAPPRWYGLRQVSVEAKVAAIRAEAMNIYVISYIATALVFLAADAVWLTVAGAALYRPMLGDLVLERFRLVPAVAFYLIYISGIVFFASSSAIASGRWLTALVNGALFGFFAYATYDLTNQATLKAWPLTITIVDLCWGTVLTGVAAALGYIIASAIARATGG
jgi:uncharacterized membrane protein